MARSLYPGFGRRGLPPHLNRTRSELIIRKGFRGAIDSYSAFFENDHTTPTGLGGYLGERGIEKHHAGRAGDRLLRGVFRARCRQTGPEHDCAAGRLSRDRPWRFDGADAWQDARRRRAVGLTPLNPIWPRRQIIPPRHTDARVRGRCAIFRHRPSRDCGRSQ